MRSLVRFGFYLIVISANVYAYAGKATATLNLDRNSNLTWPTLCMKFDKTIDNIYDLFEDQIKPRLSSATTCPTECRWYSKSPPYLPAGQRFCIGLNSKVGGTRPNCGSDKIRESCASKINLLIPREGQNELIKVGPLAVSGINKLEVDYYGPEEPDKDDKVSKRSCTDADYTNFEFNGVEDCRYETISRCRVKGAYNFNPSCKPDIHSSLSGKCQYLPPAPGYSSNIAYFSCPINNVKGDRAVCDSSGGSRIGSLNIQDRSNNGDVCKIVYVARNPPPMDGPIEEGVNYGEVNVASDSNLANSGGGVDPTSIPIPNSEDRAAPRGGETKCRADLGSATNSTACNGISLVELDDFINECQTGGFSYSPAECYAQLCEGASVSSCRDQIAIQKAELVAAKRFQDSYVSPDIEKCKEHEDKAVDCCENPLKCAFGIDVLGEASAGQLDRIITQSVGNATVGAGQSAQCRFIKNANTLMAAMHTGMATQCGSKINSCKQTCKNSIQYVESQITAGQCHRYGPNANSYSFSVGRVTPDSFRQPTCAQAQRDLLELKTPYEICKDELGAKLGQLGLQLTQNVADMAKASSCENESTQNAGPTDQFDPNSIMPNCSDAANASHPLCINLANGGNGQASGFSSVASKSSGFDSSAANLSGLPSDSEQGLNVPMTDITETESLGIGSSPGGASALGSSADPGGGGNTGSGATGAGGAGSGLNTNIGNPTSRTFSQTGGFGGVASGGGYSANAPRKRERGDDDMSLAKMLGMINKNKSAGSRSIAGFGATKKAKDVDTAYGDIFKKISDAWFRQCETESFSDCKQNLRRDN